MENIKKACYYVNFGIKEYPNLKDKEIINTIKNEIGSVERNGDDAVIFWLHSHGIRKNVYCVEKNKLGRKDCIKAANNEPVSIEEIISLFKTENCPHLNGRPKILIIDCCRSKEPDQRNQPDECNQLDQPELDQPELDQFSNTQIDPKYDNVIVLYSTLMGENFIINE